MIADVVVEFWELRSACVSGGIGAKFVSEEKYDWGDDGSWVTRRCRAVAIRAPRRVGENICLLGQRNDDGDGGPRKHWAVVGSSSRRSAEIVLITGNRIRGRSWQRKTSQPAQPDKRQTTTTVKPNCCFLRERYRGTYYVDGT